ncbi:response regulator [Pseudomonas rubra]|uniref:Response regulator n=1 Tax=Pseudomonas rubra TaxID=2942627 RepID=A0ABT5P1S3_9PSED|nr:response regulator [Pseudomonas rubra]MDD1012223.1 response regulator [Pseudomonas rubra]MDD1037430.1 response regulator [Pseudomonas rubra]MDD1153147.1 response regulator [Pseudomonas rubra]
MSDHDDILSEAEREALASVTAPAAAPLKVLIVDDDKASREALAAYLSSHGIACITEGRPEAALQYLERQSGVGVLITDLRMAPLDGLDLIGKIRESKRAELPIIIVSGDAEVEDAIAAMHLSVVDFLLKPLNDEKLEGLIRLIKRELGIHRD